MRDIFRDSAVGQWLRLWGDKQLAHYPEEFPNFKLPIEYSQEKLLETNRTDRNATRIVNEMEEGRSQIEKDITLVTWYSDDDPDNPQNWSFLKKIWIALLLLVYTISVYIGSSVYTASEPDIASIFGVSDIAAALGLSLYVIAYGMGPLLFAPLSEIPAIGRNPPYIYTYIIFAALCVATALVNNFGGLLALRFLLGFFGSPCLANAGASYGDFFGPREMPYVIALWGGGATLSPALGPLVGGFAVQLENWRWSSWELLWFSGPILLVVLISLPETSSDTILLRRAKRLRELTGRSDLKSASEIRQAQMSPRHIAFDALIKPWEINILDPAMLFTTVYTALTYGLYYSFFESFPLVYRNIYGFNLGQLGLAFLAVLIGLIVGVIVYCAYFCYVGDPKMAKMESVPPEARLWPGLIASFLIPIGLFIFAWTARKSIHWIVSLIGVSISMCGVFIIIQCMFIYLPFTYPRYAGSLFAANGFARSAFAAGAILFAGPMFSRLGVDGGVSLLGGLTVLCIFGIYGMYFGGAILRRRSKFAVS
ncbi:MFS general substrate transporter [Lepidopterella palustris CBS 459.81]|uniref:MFS general substrate transporter n=1 Tax=Lepidopterella palustris CBS 459.81 TaxID=1314670 RepID=A0A8E2EEI5_9PEZI|nr:MFS general substrate transporter [Lepidopterella palustris CBS 459.81]